MTNHRFLRAACCVAGIVLAMVAFAGGKPVTYYRKGDVGAFAATVPLPPDVNAATAAFSITTADKRLYLTYVQPPGSLFERLKARRDDNYHPKLTPAEQAKVEKLARQIGQEWEGLWRAQKKIRQTEKKIEGLTEVLKAERAKAEADRDGALIGRLQASLKPLEAEAEALREKNAGVYERVDTLEKQRQAIWDAARARAPKPVPQLALSVVGRFQGAGKARLVVLSRATDTLLAEPRFLAQLELDLPAKDGGDRGVLKTWAEAQARQFALRVLDSPYSSYYQYALLQSAKRYDLPKNLFSWALGDEGRRRRPDLYAMTTGALAIQESLQLDAMTRGRAVPTKRAVRLASLTGPTIQSHPFKKMMAGRTPTMFPAARLVPYDAYYCHFSSISKEIAASDLLKQWGASLLRAITVSARDSDVPSKYQDQLCIGVSVLTRLFGDLVIGEIALTGSDPFIKEGTDLAVIIQVKDRARFEKQMKGYRDAALARRRDAQVRKSTYQGVDILSVATADRVVSSHSCYLGAHSVYANSRQTLHRIIDTHAKRRKSMADNLDFQYMRTIFPGTPKDEDGFLYLSDAFIRKLVGPRWKVEAQRRILCQNHLRMIANAATLYRTELRKRPTLDALVKERYLPKSALTCPDGGTYSLDASGRAVCSVHNRLRHCTPVDLVTLDRVSKTEARDYKRFVREYNDYWSEYFDPIGIRFRVGDRVEAETCILPLIESSLYNQLRALVGGDPVPLRARVLTPGTLIAVTGKIDLRHKEVREMLDDMQQALPPSVPPIARCVGSSLSVNLYDGDVLFTVDPRGMGMIGAGMDLEEQLIVSTILSSISLPMYAVLDLKDEKLARTAIRELLKMAEAGTRRPRRGWDDFFSLERYATEKHGRHAVHTLVLRLAVIRVRLHYAVAHRRLIVATKPHVLKAVLDTLDKDGGGAAVTANVRLDVQPRAYQKLLPITRIGWQERMRQACAKNLVPVRALIECHGAAEDRLGEASRRVEGVTMRCPSGGTYKYDPLRNIVYCTVHGDRPHPRQPEKFTGKEDLIRFLRRMRRFSTTFRFTKEGIMTKVAFDLDPVPR